MQTGLEELKEVKEQLVWEQSVNAHDTVVKSLQKAIKWLDRAIEHLEKQEREVSR